MNPNAPANENDIPQHEQAIAAPAKPADSHLHEPQNTPTFSERTPRYTLRPGDSLDISFEFSPELNQTVAVQPDGFVALRGAGDVQVGGDTMPQVTDTLRQAFGKILHDPVINVSLKDFEKPFFIASGQLNRPGRYELRGNTSVVEAIAIAGGFNDAAKNTQVVVFRRLQNDWYETRVINVKKMLDAKNIQEDMFVHPGDLVYVPQNRFSHFKRFIQAPGLGVSMDPTRF